jgi:aldehyde dehydrogenase (NAD+)
VSTEFANFIDGKGIGTSRTIENINPSDLSDVIGHYAQADGDQLQGAIAAARRAAPSWGRTPIEQHYKALMAVGRELIARSAELGEMLSREEGKPRAEGVGEVYRAGQFFEFHAAECHRQYGENAESVRPGTDVDIRREPVGVVAVISPWNFPMAAASWKNLPTAGTDYHVPFGGRKHSSHGPREQGRAAAEFYTAVKTSYINANRAA